MTLGEKLKEIRKRFGLSQEEFAERLNVSRQAITKWENDGGIPDIANLQELSKVFQIPIDTLVNDTLDIPLYVMRIEIDKEEYGSKLKSYDQILGKYFKEPWQVYSLVKNEKENKLETALDILTGGYIYGSVKELSDLSVYALAVKDDVKLLVNIKNSLLTIKELPSNINEKKFTVDEKVFRKCALLKLNK